MLEFVRKHSNLFCILGLLLFCYLIFFAGIGTYPLMDVDETRYVLMSRDMLDSGNFLTLFLNGEYFFEKPPLYFWGEVLSFLTFGSVTEFSARFPVALYGTLSVLLLYFTGQKLVSRKYGVVSALILATSVEFLILAKYAILDILLATCVEFAVIFGFFTFFVQEKNKKYCWWLFYIFSALAVMAKGIPGLVIPFGTMFFAAIFLKKFKEVFKPQYCVVGIILFLLIVLPWHIIMLKTYDPLFFNEYIMKHHINRFLSSTEIHRQQPFYFYFLTFLWGFMPWLISAVTVAVDKLAKFKKEKIKFSFNLNNLTTLQKYLFLNFVAFVFIFLFFSASSTKLITYILPVYFAAANILAWVWTQYLNDGKYEKPIKIASYIFFGLFFVASIVGLFTPLFLPEKIYQAIISVKWFTLSLTFVFGLLGLIFTFKNKRTALFATYVAFFTVLSAFGMPKFFQLDFSFGQNDLMEFAKYAKAENLIIKTVNMGKNKFSLNYYGTKNVIHNVATLETLQNDLNTAENNVVFIVKQKDIRKMEHKPTYTEIKKGVRYSLIKK